MKDLTGDSWVVLMRHKRHGTAAMRVSTEMLDKRSPEEKSDQASDLHEYKKQILVMARAQCKAMLWKGHTRFEVLGPMPPLLSRLIYDAIPGDRLSPSQIRHLIHEAEHDPRSKGEQYESMRTEGDN